MDSIIEREKQFHELANHRKESEIQNETRKIFYNMIKKENVVTARAIADNFPNYTYINIVYHLDVLKREGFINSIKYRSRNQYFLVNGVSEEEILEKRVKENGANQSNKPVRKKHQITEKPQYENLDEKLLHVLRNPLTRGQLREIVNVPRTTLFDHLKVLETKGKVKRKIKRARKRGRPKTYWSTVKQEGFILC